MAREHSKDTGGDVQEIIKVLGDTSPLARILHCFCEQGFEPPSELLDALRSINSDDVDEEGKLQISFELLRRQKNATAAIEEWMNSCISES